MRQAFTKLEVTIVFGVLGIIALIFFPIFGRPRENDGPRSSGSSCQSNLKQISLGILQYAQDYDEKFPLTKPEPKIGWTIAIYPYLKSWPIFYCPATTLQPVNTLTSYFYNSRLAGISGGKIEDRRKIILLGDGQPNSPSDYAISVLPTTWITDSRSPSNRHRYPFKVNYGFFESKTYGANYSFADGHVKWMQPEKITLGNPKTSTNYTFLPR